MQYYTLFYRSACGVAVLAAGLLTSNAVGQETETVKKKTTEPVFRVSRLLNKDVEAESNVGTKLIAPAAALPATTEAPAARASVPVNKKIDAKLKTVDLPTKDAVAGHPLDRALDFAQQSLAQMRSEMFDYTAVMAKRERINGRLSKTSYMKIKVRCPRTDSAGNKQPFSIYMKFLKPRDEAGREVLWVDGQNSNNLVVHQPGGLVGMRTFELDPKGMLAMQGQKYPIYDAGLENLTVKLIEKASRDRAAGMCEVNYRSGLKMKGRSCSMIELVHQQKRAPYEFYKAQVVVDDQLNLPVRYTSYDWPRSPGAELDILEQYTYINIKPNVGLQDIEFSPSNPKYNFPGR